MTYHCVCNNSNTTSAPSGSELLTVLPNHYFPVYCLCSVDHCLSFWPLYFLSFDLRLLNEYHFGIFQLFLDQCCFKRIHIGKRLSTVWFLTHAYMLEKVFTNIEKYYTLRFYFPFLSLLAQTVNILVYWPGPINIMFSSGFCLGYTITKICRLTNLHVLSII
jgi:hypothetical protein